MRTVVMILFVGAFAGEARAQTITLTGKYNAGNGLVTLEGSYDLGANYELASMDAPYYILSTKDGMVNVERLITLVPDKDNPKTKGTFGPTGYIPGTGDPWVVAIRIDTLNTANKQKYWVYSPAKTVTK